MYFRTSFLSFFLSFNQEIKPIVIQTNAFRGLLDLKLQILRSLVINASLHLFYVTVILLFIARVSSTWLSQICRGHVDFMQTSVVVPRFILFFVGLNWNGGNTSFVLAFFLKKFVPVTCDNMSSFFAAKGKYLLPNFREFASQRSGILKTL